MLLCITELETSFEESEKNFAQRERDLETKSVSCSLLVAISYSHRNVYLGVGRVDRSLPSLLRYITCNIDEKFS